ncbi:MAG: hypothetical protein IM585_22450 [Pseudanabaena sp. M135S2SP2A07QC]|nr:hypothetical protein [Pseudanabaena sp. M176S2SP2A07QC]MCA6540399.1 hypothetical protein [Pseudanabaena sp. M037S2SP2A07QC]MCA6542508.1 hypothetical protein [Pseudanabaena sp. M074S1SP2A07QC]MCA6547700.1 hypothetical protein [Pseudanabaena sp. M152S2SP2A07QC]MCA6554648.1 hypothetical protein [Pseudanabaena sp. M135S2SP2A07QC]MCA6566548.1 hypothetical protein [Pseudanabaena sp. M151S2SP2A07QC]MCA6570351.1 hypothetical protein [Pseudanabaena sp. M065S1SP2A07QC]MCA6580055.1 hypothetical prot
MQNFSQYITYRSLLAKKQGKGFSEVEAKDILRQVLTQLIRLHDQKQAHGSISLDTVAYDPNRMQIILLAGNGSNNPIYLAPEVLQNRQTNPTADIYALGVVMIVLLTGLPPEALKTPNNTWNWEDRCIVSDQLIQILNIALTLDRDFRYVNAGQMLHALQPIISMPEPKIESTIINPAIRNPLNNLAVPLPPSIGSASKHPQSLQSQEIPSISEIDTPIQSDVDNTESNDSHKIQKLKADLPNSPTYRNAKPSKDTSKSKSKSKICFILAILLSIGVTAGLGAAYFFYTQFKSAETAKKNLEFANAVTQSADAAIARIYEEKKVNENIEKLITLAKDKYESSGNLTEATTILQAVPLNSPIRKKADSFLSQWQEDNTKNSSLIQEAEQAAKDGKWQLAIDTIKNISSTPYWQKRGQKIADEAKKKLVTPIVQPPQVVTPSSSQDIASPPVETYTPTETYNPPPDPPPANSSRQAPPLPPPAN